MVFSIRQNLSAYQAHQNMVAHDTSLNHTLQKIASGSHINRAADAPAAYFLSGQLQTQRDGLWQSNRNNAVAINFVQTAEAAIASVSASLVEMRKIAVHAANDATNNTAVLVADQQEINEILAHIDSVAEKTSFGSRLLLNGQNAVTGSAIGEGLSFLSADLTTEQSPAAGYPVNITKAASQSTIATKSLDEGLLEKNPVILVHHQGQSVQQRLAVGQDLAATARAFNRSFQEQKIPIEAVFDQREDRLIFNSSLFGSAPAFQVASSDKDVFASPANTWIDVQNGEDIAGDLGGYPAVGQGQTLTGVEHTPVANLKVQYTGNIELETQQVGTVVVDPNQLFFQLGPSQQEQAGFSLHALFSKNLARNLENDSGFSSLAQIDVQSFNGAQNSLLLIERATQEVAVLRAKLGSLQKNTLESNLAYTASLKENIVSSDSTIIDTDVAERSVDLIKQQLMVESAAAASVHSGASGKINVNLLNKNL